MVRYWHYFFLIVCFWHLSPRAGSDEELFLRANNHSEQKDWARALSLYMAIKNKGSAVWYNMGSCSYYLKKYTEALVYWKRAQRGTSYKMYEKIMHNQHILMQRLGKTVSYSWIQRLYRLFMYIVSGISLLFLQLLFFCCWYGAFFLWRYQDKKFLFTALFLLVLSGLVGAGVMVKYEQENVIGIVAMDDVAVFAGPNQKYHVIDQLDYVDQVVIQSTKPDWYKVTYATGVGWVTTDAIQVV